MEPEVEDLHLRRLDLGVSYDDNAKALIAAATCGNQNGGIRRAPGLSSPRDSPLNAMASGSITNVTNCDPNWQMGYVGTRTQWNITSQFYMGVDVLYTKIYTGFAGLGVSALRGPTRSGPPASTPSRTRTTGP